MIINCATERDFRSGLSSSTLWMTVKWRLKREILRRYKDVVVWDNYKLIYCRIIIFQFKTHFICCRKSLSFIFDMLRIRLKRAHNTHPDSRFESPWTLGEVVECLTWLSNKKRENLLQKFVHTKWEEKLRMCEGKRWKIYCEKIEGGWWQQRKKKRVKMAQESVSFPLSLRHLTCGRLSTTSKKSFFLFFHFLVLKWHVNVGIHIKIYIFLRVKLDLLLLVSVWAQAEECLNIIENPHVHHFLISTLLFSLSLSTVGDDVWCTHFNPFLSFWKTLRQRGGESADDDLKL